MIDPSELEDLQSNVFGLQVAVAILLVCVIGVWWFALKDIGRGEFIIMPSPPTQPNRITPLPIEV